MLVSRALSPPLKQCSLASTAIGSTTFSLDRHKTPLEYGSGKLELKTTSYTSVACRHSYPQSIFQNRRLSAKAWCRQCVGLDLSNLEVQAQFISKCPRSVPAQRNVSSVIVFGRLTYNWQVLGKICHSFLTRSTNLPHIGTVVSM